MSRWRGEVHEDGLAIRQAVADKKRAMARYVTAPGDCDERHRTAARRLLEAADEIEQGDEPLRLCVRRDADGTLSIFNETYGLPGPRGRWFDVHADGRMTAVPAAWVTWHEQKLAAVRRASRTEDAQAALAVAAEWDQKEPR